jgi:hypothetical protein
MRKPYFARVTILCAAQSLCIPLPSLSASEENETVKVTSDRYKEVAGDLC